MKGVIRIINELDKRSITNSTLESRSSIKTPQIFLVQDGKIILERGKEICTWTTLSSVTSLKQEIK